MKTVKRSEVFMFLDSVGFRDVWFIDARGEMGSVYRFLPVDGASSYSDWLNSPLWDQVGQLLLNA